MAFVMQEPMTTPAGQPGVLDQMSEARATCRELLQLLAIENASLKSRKVDEVEARLQMKRRLTLRLEMTLKDLKDRRQEWVGRADAQAVALHLAEEVGAFQTLAAHNLELLKAAHQIRADMVSVIRDTLDARAPRVQTYGRSGYMANGGTGQRMVAREI